MAIDKNAEQKRFADRLADGLAIDFQYKLSIKSWIKYWLCKISSKRGKAVSLRRKGKDRGRNLTLRDYDFPINYLIKNYLIKNQGKCCGKGNAFPGKLY